MKKELLTTTLMLLGSMLVFTACKKDTGSADNNTTTSTTGTTASTSSTSSTNSTATTNTTSSTGTTASTSSTSSTNSTATTSTTSGTSSTATSSASNSGSFTSDGVTYELKSIGATETPSIGSYIYVLSTSTTPYMPPSVTLGIYTGNAPKATGTYSTAVMGNSGQITLSGAIYGSGNGGSMTTTVTTWEPNRIAGTFTIVGKSTTDATTKTATGSFDFVY